MAACSEEQDAIVRAVLRGRDVYTDAIAGAGKTTTVLELARRAALRGKRVILLTYNRGICDAVKERIERMGITNVKAHTYHSAAGHFYGRDNACRDDTALRRLVADDPPPAADADGTGGLADHGFLVLDEVQDMKDVLYKFVRKMRADMGDHVLWTMGDHRQNVYAFMYSDARYLQLAPSVWRLPAMAAMGMRVTYRVPGPIVRFINEAMLGEQRMVAAKPEGEPVLYIKTDNLFKLFETVEFAQAVINPLIAWRHYKDADPDVSDDELRARHPEILTPGDVFVLAPHYRPGSPFLTLEHILRLDKRIPTNVKSDSQTVNEAITKDKVSFLCFPSAKGLERPVTIVLGFDLGSCTTTRDDARTQRDAALRDRDAALRARCPDAYYVAASRAMSRLIVIESTFVHPDPQKQRPMGPPPFLKMTPEQLEAAPFVRVVHHKTKRDIATVAPPQAELRTFTLRPSQAVKFIKNHLLADIERLAGSLFAVLPDNVRVANAMGIKGEVVDPATGFVENVAAINGFVLPAMWERSRAGAASAVETRLLQNAMAPGFLAFCRLPNEVARAAPRCIRELVAPAGISDWLRIGVAYFALQNGVAHPLKQIGSFDWIKPNSVRTCFTNMNSVIREDHLAFEVVLQPACGEAENDVSRLFAEVLELDPRVVQTRVAVEATLDVVGAGADGATAAVYEVKCTSELALEHRLQLVVYAWLWRVYCRNAPVRFKLVNIKTGRVEKLDAARVADVDRLMRLVVRSTWAALPSSTDDEFLASL